MVPARLTRRAIVLAGTFGPLRTRRRGAASRARRRSARTRSNGNIATPESGGGVAGPTRQAQPSELVASSDRVASSPASTAWTGPLSGSDGATSGAAESRVGLEKNPIMKVKGLDTSDHVTYTEEEPNALTPEEVQRFLAAMRDRHPQHFAMVALGFATGWLPSMMRPLRRTGPTPDVLWDRNLVLARRSRIWASYSPLRLQDSRGRITPLRRAVNIQVRRGTDCPSACRPRGRYEALAPPSTYASEPADRFACPRPSASQRIPVQVHFALSIRCHS
jgi:hypothetical protein